jgi:uncharacterized protein YbjT (DUF2867 family)
MKVSVIGGTGLIGSQVITKDLAEAMAGAHTVVDVSNSPSFADATIGEPLNGIINIAGPEKLGMDDFVRTRCAASGDPRRLGTDPSARYFGAIIDAYSIVAIDGDDATIYPTRFCDCMASRVTRGAHQEA